MRFFAFPLALMVALLSSITMVAQYPEAQVSDPNYPFYHGVASGDALSDRVIVWTRVSAADTPASVEVTYTLSTEADMSAVATTGTFTTGADRDYTVKVDVTGLDANTWYYYQFEALGGSSPIGRTRTLPTTLDDPGDFRFALASCANYEGGYFNAYGDIAARNDLDAVFQVGDYIYEYGGGTYGNGVRFHLPNTEVITVEEYRARHSNYKLDEDLAAAHRQYPWYMSWDDHETVNNSYATGAQNHDPATEGDWITRRNAALQAYYEWNPVRDIVYTETSVPAYRAIQVGDLAKFYILETRLNARSPEVPLPNVDLLYTDPGAYFADAANLQGIYTSNTASLDPNRTMLGDDQKAWLTGEFAASTAQWNVVVNQTVMAGLPIADLTEPLDVLGGASIADAFAAQSGGLDIGSAVFLSYDNWDGFAADRAWLYGTMNAVGVSNPVVLTGDIHSSWANTLVDFLNPTETVGVEFVTTQVAGDVRSFGQSNESVEALVPWVEYFNQVSNGYTVIDLDATRAQADYVVVQSTLGNIVSWDNPTGNTGIEDRENFTTVVDGSYVSYADSYRPLVADALELDTLPRSILAALSTLPEAENDAPLAEDMANETTTGGECGLFFSEYAEGSSNNKYLEIYNPTDAAIDLTAYAFPNVGNAPNVPGEYEFWNAFDAGATIGAGETYMIVHPSAEAGLLAVADMTFSFLSNGDDGFILVEGTEADFTLVDAIGNWDGDPGSGWDVAGVNNGTKDHTLRRKSDVTSGNAGDWFASAGTNAEDSEWIVLENDYSINNGYEGLDSHDFTGSCGAPEPGEELTMRIFHNNDGESVLLGVDHFGALLNDMRDASDQAGIPHVMVSSGDNVKPGLAFNVFLEGGPSYDAIALDHLDYNGICIGNHDFDAGTEVLADLIEAFPNNPTPFLSANLDFTNEPSLDALVQQGRIARSITLDVDGQQVGLIGLTTRDLAAVTSPGNTLIGEDLAGILQAEVDSLEGLGINKIILVSHLQGLVADDLDGGGDFAIASQTRGIDVWVAGGGSQMLTNDPDYNDIYAPYPSAEETAYPLVAQNVDGEPVYMVTTVGNYDYLGALQVTFDGNGVVVDTYSDEYSDTYRASDYAGSDQYLYDNVVAPIEAIYADADTIGFSEIAWDLRKTTIRARESGFGNVVADAFLAAGRRFAEIDPNVDSPQMAITNGGGLRTDVLYDAGAITDLQVQNILPFDNTIAVVEDVPTDRLKLILENAYSKTSFQNGAVYADDGRFGHIAGLTVVYDIFGTSYEHNAQGQTLVEGDRVVSAILDDGTVLIENGTPVPGLTVDIATNNFLAEGGPAFSGGDYYPFDQNVPANLTTELYAESVIEFIVDTLGGLVAAVDYPEDPGTDAGRIQVLVPACDDPNGCVYGCDDVTACNFDETVTSNDGTCVFPEEGLDCEGNCASDSDEDGICDQDEVGGCNDQSACNFDPNATDNNGSCEYPEPGSDCGTGTCDLFISEYGVQSGTQNRYVEIYNPTSYTVNLDNYAWPNVSNSNPFPGSYEYWNTFNEGAMLAPGEVYVIAHPEADAAILAEADQTFQYIADGNVGFAIVKGQPDSFEIVDFFANWEGDNDEIGFWNVCGDAQTDNVVLVRLPEFQGNPLPSGMDNSSEDGVTEFVGGSFGTCNTDCEWAVRSADDYSGLGAHEHNSGCAQVEPATCDLFISEYGVVAGTSNRYVEIYNPTGAPVLLDDYAWPNVSNSNPFPGAYEYWNGFNAGHVLQPGDVYVLAHPDADAAILAEADQTFPYMPDGNAGFALVRGTEADFEIIDFFANYEGDNDEIGYWSVCDGSTTDNVVLVRRPQYQGNPNPSGEDLSSEDGITEFFGGSLGSSANDCEWFVRSTTDFSDLGMHTYSGACAQPEIPACDLFISEYGVGSASNRWIEIYNPTGYDVLLDGYAWPNVSNSNPFPGSYEYWNGFNAGHVLAAGDVYILAHPDADAAILAEADQTFPYMPDGNAGFALVKGTETDFEIIDFFANYEGDNDEVGFWTVCGDETVTTDNVTLVRKPFYQGNPNPSGEDRSSEDGVTEFTMGSLAAGVCEWDIYAADDFSHIGMHTYEGLCTQPPVQGCMDETACNYDELAEIEGEGDCDYESCVGCMVFQACNYNALASQNDYELCDFSECAGCTYEGACNYDPTASQDNGSCEYLVGDLNGSGAVTAADILLMLSAFTSTCD